MPSGEDSGTGQGDQSVSAGRDAYGARGDIKITDNSIHYHLAPGTHPPGADGPDGPHPGDDPWTVLARDHVAWKKAATPGRDELREASLKLIATLHRRYTEALESSRDDPWLYEELPLRMAEEVGLLLDGLPDEEGLTAAEAALLTVVPCLRAAYRMVQVSELRPRGAILDALHGALR